MSNAAMKRCPCGYLPLPDATHCPKCGKPIEPARSAGAQIDIERAVRLHGLRDA